MPTELLAFLASNGPAVYDSETKEYNLLNDIEDYETYYEIENYLALVGYKFFYETDSDCWVVMEDLDL